MAGINEQSSALRQAQAEPTTMDMNWREIDRCAVIPGGFNLAEAAQEADPEMRCGQDTL